MRNYIGSRAFTLIETLVAVSLISVAIVAPMTLVERSLTSAYYARDQITAYNLAQEGVEAVRAIRDGNILSNALTNSNTDILTGIPISQPFVIDARNDQIWTTCPTAQVRTDGTIYGYGDPGDPCFQNDPAWPSTNFTRTITATYVGGNHDEIRVSAMVTWKTAGGQTRSFAIYENMYRWVNDGSATP